MRHPAIELECAATWQRIHHARAEQAQRNAIEAYVLACAGLLALLAICCLLGQLVQGGI